MNDIDEIFNKMPYSIQYEDEEYFFEMDLNHCYYTNFEQKILITKFSDKYSDGLDELREKVKPFTLPKYPP